MSLPLFDKINNHTFGPSFMARKQFSSLSGTMIIKIIPIFNLRISTGFFYKSVSHEKATNDVPRDPFLQHGPSGPGLPQHHHAGHCFLFGGASAQRLFPRSFRGCTLIPLFLPVTAIRYSWQQTPSGRSPIRPDPSTPRGVSWVAGY